jgi:hypothetical protein
MRVDEIISMQTLIGTVSRYILGYQKGESHKRNVQRSANYDHSTFYSIIFQRWHLRQHRQLQSLQGMAASLARER